MINLLISDTTILHAPKCNVYCRVLCCDRDIESRFPLKFRACEPTVTSRGSQGAQGFTIVTSCEGHGWLAKIVPPKNPELVCERDVQDLLGSRCCKPNDRYSRLAKTALTARSSPYKTYSYERLLLRKRQHKKHTSRHFGSLLDLQNLLTTCLFTYHST